MKNVLKKITDTTGNLVKGGADAVASTGKSVVDSASTGIQSGIGVTTALASEIAKAPTGAITAAKGFTTDQKAKVYDALFTAVDLKVYAIQVGEDANDVEIWYDKDKFHKQLSLNPFAVPRILLYAGRSDLDLEKLHNEIQAMIKEDYEADSAVIQARAKEMQSQNRDELTRSLGMVVNGAESSVFWWIISLLAGPFAPLVMLIAFGNGLETISEIVSLPRKAAKAATETILSPFSSAKSGASVVADDVAVSRSLKNITLAMHTQLMRVVEVQTGSAQAFRSDIRDGHDLPPVVKARVDELI